MTSGPAAAPSGLLGIVLARAEDLDAAVALAAAARAAGHPVSLFAMAEGAGALAAAGPRSRAARATLLDADCELIACATSLDQHGLAAPDGILVGSQDDHAALVARAARLVALT